ncbi:MerR family transcriptional regulator [Nocardioides caldifontis]|uniref:MerR family transcriptional regulator n=1 Tax=Nocardioides caldifontis TaxID=2588938 RepID=UPI0011E01290|nr:MerR family transcriptional regulator [Nocardioides caldifontis]
MPRPFDGSSPGPAPHGLDRRGLYGISVTAELTGVAPPNLRAYEAKGLIEPTRTEGGTRRYSEHDLHRIARISGLLDEGLNLRGIGYVLELEAETQRLRQEIEELRARLGRGAARGGSRDER